MRLYSYWRSSAAYRVRIALNLKALEYEVTPVDLLQDPAGEGAAAYRSVNPQGLIPALQVGEDTLFQSLAIVEYLDERYPDPPLLGRSALDKARIRAASQTIACEIHPLNNLRVLNHLRREFALAEDAVGAWYRHWIAAGFSPLEQLVRATPGSFSCGDTVTMADVCLVPQMYNARRFDCDLTAYPALVEVCERLESMPAVAAAAPELQPDAR